MAGRRTVSIGFSGSGADQDAQFDLTACVGKRSLEYSATMRLLAAGVGPLVPLPAWSGVNDFAA
jgi:hypothetical protein